jgi:hypothetical protein
VTMSKLFGLVWYYKAFLAMLCAVPLVFFAEYFRANYDMKSEGVLLAYMAGIVVGILIFSFFSVGEFRVRNLSTPALPLLAIFVIGLFFGTMSQSLLVSAMFDPGAKSTAFPYAIYGMNPAVAYIIICAVALVFQQSFRFVQFSVVNVFGLIMMGAGVALVLWKK